MGGGGGRDSGARGGLGVGASSLPYSCGVVGSCNNYQRPLSVYTPVSSCAGLGCRCCAGACAGGLSLQSRHGGCSSSSSSKGSRQGKTQKCVGYRDRTICERLFWSEPDQVNRPSATCGLGTTQTSAVTSVTHTTHCNTYTAAACVYMVINKGRRCTLHASGVWDAQYLIPAADHSCC